MDAYAWTNHLLYLEQTDSRLTVSTSTVLVEIAPDLQLPAPLPPAFARMLRDAVLGRAVRAMQQYLNNHQQPESNRFRVESPVAWSTTEAEHTLLGAEQPAVVRAALDVQRADAAELAASADLADAWTLLTLPHAGDMVVGLPDAMQVRVAQHPERFALVALLLLDGAPLDLPVGNADAETVVTLAMQHSAVDAPLPLDVLAARIYAADAQTWRRGMTWLRGMVCDHVHDGSCSYDVAQDTLTISAAQRAFLDAQLEQAGWPAAHPARAARDAQAQAQFGLLVLDAVHTAREDDDTDTLTLLTPHLWQCLRAAWVNQSPVTPQLVCAYAHLPTTTIVQVMPWLRHLMDDATTAAATPELVAVLLDSALALVVKINRLHTQDARRAGQTAVQVIAQWMQPHGPLAQARIAHTQAQLLDHTPTERAALLDTALQALTADSISMYDAQRDRMRALVLERAWLALAAGDVATATAHLATVFAQVRQPRPDGAVLLPLDEFFGGLKQPEAAQLVLARLAWALLPDVPLEQLERAWYLVQDRFLNDSLPEDVYALLVGYAPQIIAAFARHAADDPLLFRAARLAIADVAEDAAGALYGEDHPVTGALATYAASVQMAFPDGPGELDGDDIAAIVTDLRTTHHGVVASVAWFREEYDVRLDLDRMLLAWFDAAGLFEDVDGRAFDERWAVPRTLRSVLPGVWMQRLADIPPPRNC